MPDVIEIWVKRLRDPDVQVRCEAIRQLEAIGDPDTLGPLAVIFALDPDFEARRLAQWAGKSIYQAFARQQAQGHDAVSAAERIRAAEILQKAHAKKNKS
jgi:HEAT repeat protein